MKKYYKPEQLTKWAAEDLEFHSSAQPSMLQIWAGPG